MAEKKENYIEVSIGNKEEEKMSAEEMKSKRDRVMAERNKKLQERMAAMAQRRMKRSATSSSKQQKATIEKFINEFSTKYDKIEDDICKQRKHEEFKQLKIRAFKLESFLADNASILPSYTFEAKNKMMTNLKNKINKIQQEIAPKPKFTFSQKFKKTNKIININNNNNNDKEEKEEDINNNNNKLNDINNNEIKIENKKLETIYFKYGDINGSDVCLSNLINCTISICDNIGALRMNNIKHCIIITGPISSSLHVEYIEKSTINSIMRQCRIHYCKDTKFYIHVNSQPVIEYSDNVQFAPYNVKYKELNKNWEKSNVDKNINQWDNVKDFNWFKQQQSPHWSIIPKQERTDVVRPIVDDDDDDEL